MRPDAPDPGQVAAGYPRVDLPPGYITEDEDTAYSEAVDTPGLVLVTEPVTHDAGDVDTVQPSPEFGGIARAPYSPTHQRDEGRPLAGSYELPLQRAEDERPVTERWSNAPVSRGSTLAALRGDNSLPENNPDGFPTGTSADGEGHSVKRFYHREMPHEYQRHTERWLRQAGAARAVVSPAMAPDNSNRYTSPFAWRSFYPGALLQSPIMRRNPPEQWTDQTSDGTDETSDIPADWVIG